MADARVVIDPTSTVGDIDERLFGGFIEHMGRAVYGGIYEPGHPTAGADGWRRDVIDLVRRLGVSIVRYRLASGRLTVDLPARSWSALTLTTPNRPVSA